MPQQEYVHLQVPAQYYQQYMYRQSHTDPPDSYPGPPSLQNWCAVFWKAVMGCLIMIALLVVVLIIRCMYELYRAKPWF
jgi:hypothetical protein